ncbi:MAG: response regulator transcription factor [Armatimonadetes bacterium]|nr:response regulator transcription factor [Armatimonadota bacterium]
MTAIRVLVVDDHRLVAESIARLLQDFSDLQVVGQASTGPEAISLARQLNPSVILMDIGMPGMDGVDATWTLTRQFPSIPVLMLTMFDHEAYVIESLRAGASGYLVKTAGADELVRAIRSVYEGKPVLHPQIASAALQRLATRGRLGAKDPFALTQREVQII